MIYKPEILVYNVLEIKNMQMSHILTKLGVSRRSEAKTAAKKLRLVPEHL